MRIKTSKDERGFFCIPKEGTLFYFDEAIIQVGDLMKRYFLELSDFSKEENAYPTENKEFIALIIDNKLQGQIKK